MRNIVLSSDEVATMQALVASIARRYESPEHPAFLSEGPVFAHELPRRIRLAFHEFKLVEPISGIVVVSGYPVDKVKIGATPKHWSVKERVNRTFEEEVLLLLLGFLLGEPIAWATQQDGHLVHDIFPIKGHEGEQLGTGSEQLLSWHVEDAFHPYRGDYLGMLCLRNPDRVPTTFASLERIHLTAEQLQLLFEPHYSIRPDESHLMKNRGQPTDHDDGVSSAYGRIENMMRNPPRIPVLFGNRDSPYIRLDPYFMDPVRDNAQAQAAFDEFVHQIDAVLEDVVLQPGDFCFIDNYKAVHGRKPFRARYDGNDRWLKRVNLTRDLRKSIDARGESTSRVIT